MAGEVLLLDEVGDHAALVCADVMARLGCSVTLVTPDRMAGHDLGPTNSAVVLRDLARQGVVFDCLLEPVSVAAEGNRKRVTLRHVLTGEKLQERVVDHVVSEHGITPAEELYHALKPGSRNLGQLDHQKMIAGRSPYAEVNPAGKFWLARAGDAVAGRNIHAAVYDALRLCKDL